MRVEHGYDVTPGELLAVLTDEEFLAARSARYGGNGDPSVERSGRQVVVTVPRRLPLDAVPAPFRRFAGTGELVQTDTWPGAAGGAGAAGGDVSGSWTVDPGASPLLISGSHEITATDSGCSYVVTAEVQVKVRFIGGQAEGIIRQQLAQLIGHEQDFAATWLAEHGG